MPPPNTKDNPSSSDLIVAWSAQVSFPQLCSSLLAYVETKAAITTLRLVSRKSGLISLKRVPEEIILKIGDNLRDAKFRRNMKGWVGIQQCFEGNCRMSKHATLEEYDEGVQATIEDGLDVETDLKDYFKDDVDGVWHSCHQDVLKDMSFELTIDRRSNFMRAAQIFYQEFSILPYVLATKKSVNDGTKDCTINSVDARAYLLLPVAGVPVASNPGHKSAGFVVNSELDPSVLKDLSPDQSKVFKTAAQVLKLHPYDKHEYESDYVDRDKPKYGIYDLDTFYEAEMVGSEDESESENAEDNLEKKSFKLQLRIFGCKELEAFTPGRWH